MTYASYGKVALIRVSIPVGLPLVHDAVLGYGG